MAIAKSLVKIGGTYYQPGRELPSSLKGADKEFLLGENAIHDDAAAASEKKAAAVKAAAEKKLTDEADTKAKAEADAAAAVAQAERERLNAQGGGQSSVPAATQ